MGTLTNVVHDSGQGRPLRPAGGRYSRWTTVTTVTTVTPGFLRFGLRLTLATDLRIYPLPPPLLEHPVDAHLRIKLPPAGA